MSGKRRSWTWVLFPFAVALLLLAACSPPAGPGEETIVPPPPTTLPTPPALPTAEPTAAPSSTLDPRTAIEADLENFTRVRAEAEKTLDPELLRQVCVDPYLAKKIALIGQNEQGGVHWETRSVSLTITSLDTGTAGQAQVGVRKTETKLFFPAGSSLPDDEVCTGPLYSYRDCTYEVLYTMVWQEGHWYVADAVDSGDCQGRCRQIPPEPTVGPSVPVSFDGITFSYDVGLATGVVPEIVPGATEDSDRPWTLPQHDRFFFQGYALPGANDEPVLRVYPVAGYEAVNEPARATIADLRQLLAERPAVPAHIPFLPYQGAQ